MKGFKERNKLSMKIMHLLQSDQFSGAENVVCQICKISECNSNIQMLYVSKDGPIKKALKERNIHFYGMKKLNYSNVKKIIKEYKPDIIHAHDVSASVLASLNKSKKIKIISHMHVNNKNMSRINIKTIVYLLASIFFSHIFWVSNSSFDGYIFKKFIKNKSSILVNVLNKDDIYERLNKAEITDKKDIIFIGRMQSQKNPEKLIEILKELKKINNGFTAALVGDGILLDEIRKKIKENELENNVTLYGYVDNPLALIHNAKVMVITSRFEGTPMCALEAMALGTPIISTPIDGMKKLIVNGENGFLENENVEFSKKINDLINSEKLREHFSKDTIKKFENMMNLQKYYKEILKYYKE